MPHPPISPDADLAVPTETFADHIVLRPPNRLKQRAARRPSKLDEPENDAIIRAERALEMLSQEFDGWMAAEVGRLESARLALAKYRDDVSLGALYRSAHDIRGQAATFGFPLVGEIAEGLCGLVEAAGSRLLPQAIIDRHVESIRAIVRENAKGRDNALGVALAERLGELRAEHAQDDADRS